MEAFPKSVEFCYPWRSYQAEVLKNLDEHLENNHLHLIAPPGSGKTVLGLEVMLRLNKPTLIVAPTLAIRNQWVDRFVSLFLQVNEVPDWISMDLRNPTFLTVTTYQGLHALFDENGHDDTEQIDDEEAEEVEVSEKEVARDKFFECNFQTLILDEAHHLRTSWWRTLTDVRKKLTNLSTVALTATPPYDVDKSEWDRYIELCGPIDEEIEVAALVKEGDLCPHQDYIWMSKPTKQEQGPIEFYHREVEQFKNDLLHNEDFQQLIQSHPWIQSEEFVEEKLANHAYFISMILYLKEIGSNAWEKPFQLVDEKAEHLPEFDLEWTQELLTSLLYKDKWVDPKEEPIKSIRKKLSAIGAIERRRVQLIATKAMERTLLHSTSKLDSINKIILLEKKSLGDSLRLVILADYIYGDDLPKSKEDISPLVRLGVIPVFESARRELGEQCKLGVLTGSIVIIPKSSLPLLEKSQLKFEAEVLVHDERYVKISWQRASRQRMVQVITEIFAAGEIDVLVGTTALLGEGWDAPSVNTLILASYVGTFMLTNQMRGRAIRIEKGNPEKAANIWHLVCVDSALEDGGYDLKSLRRRFRSLTGVDEELPLIVSGIDRLRIPQNDYTKATIEEINQEMTRRAIDRSRLFTRWKRAVSEGSQKREELQVDKVFIPRPFILRNTLKSLVLTSIITIAYTFNALAEKIRFSTVESNEGVVYLSMGLIFGVLASSPFWWKALRIFLFNSSIEKRMKSVGEAIYHTLYEIGLLQTPPSENRIYTEQAPLGEVYCHLERGTKYEQKLFLQALQELLDPIENPRYILHRQSGKTLWVKHDYHALPEEIGRRKDYAETFLAQWQKKIGKAELIYTRTPEGRKLLLKARMRAMSAKFVKRSERLSVWK
ncbi:DEAD/DEAH box helicase family protein [Oceanobacillus luteolus]|uniref:DEAD/DEAH box helicase family protein n=1 Tax=Oceanobacillus luteolus TaxID=1274358 RepID=UPI00203DFAD4|nr:DEAD/DEAH box helicase family protein [Oceanobacillus luteolus]MCM3739696.1 DEAD/DEAH box helicase family protein [Oceanobacillus luteolus]